ncbi:uncharacterized protein [Oscarella lobularis]|uniref:uncharacterized protein n=1 Tax=Oscarella lobularis TaxID=121494 RepID=UPI0033139854
MDNLRRALIPLILSVFFSAAEIAVSLPEEADLLSTTKETPSSFGHSAIFGHNDFTLSKLTCGHACTHVAFSSPFLNLQSSETVHVQAGVGFRRSAAALNQTALSTWIQGVTNRGFDACAARSGLGGPLELSVEWLAYVSTRRSFLMSAPRDLIQDAVVDFSDFTAEKHCREETSTALMSNLLTTAVRSVPEVTGADGAFLWTENTGERRFGFCYKEAQIFSGVHSGFQTDVLTFNGSLGLQSLVDGAEVGQLYFMESELGAGSACKIVSFQSKYYRDTRPTVLVSPEVPSAPQQDTVTIAYTEMASQSSVRICVKSTQPVDMLVTWAAVGIVDPCVGVVCDYFGVCVDTGPYTFRCDPPTCTDVDDPVCASNAVTYDNECEYQRFIFRTRQSEIAIHHNGNCYGFSFQRGNVVARPSSKSSTTYDCETIFFNSHLFYPNKPIHALVTVDHRNAVDASYIHDAPVAWIDRLTNDSLTACVYVAGRSERHDTTDVSLDWLVYQGAPDGSMGGVFQLDSEWWTGTTCEKVTMERAFSSPPLVLATLRHSVKGLKHDAASLWVEDIRTDSFSLCVRELQNFDGAHENISITWLAVGGEARISKTIFSDQGLIAFSGQDLQPSQLHDFAFCKSVEYSRTYPSSPTVLVSPSHKTTISRHVPAVYNDIVAWVEDVSVSEFLVCVKEIRVRSNSYDPLSVNYVVLPAVCEDGWLPHEGYCYKSSSRCQSWTAANSTCENKGGSLASVHDEQEAYFVGALSSGKSWIGLHRAADDFDWTDGTDLDFLHWAAKQPNNYRNSQNCVLELGSKKLYHWNDEQCGYCHSYVCQKDVDECETGTHECAVDAKCMNSEGAFSCACVDGYVGDGRKCTPNECVLGTHDCDENAVCADTEDGFNCTCKSGFFGDGTSCTTCPSGYSPFQQSCYKYFLSPKSWQDARAQCQADGGDLVSIANQEEYTFVQSLYSSGFTWLGYNDIGHEGRFVWSDGSPYTFQKWSSIQPDNFGNEDCAHTHGGEPSSTWNDLPCTHQTAFVCEA